MVIYLKSFQIFSVEGCLRHSAAHHLTRTETSELKVSAKFRGSFWWRYYMPITTFFFLKVLTSAHSDLKIGMPNAY